MRVLGRELEGYPKVLAFLVAVLLVSGGLCGLQLAVNEGAPTAVQGIFMATGAIELVAFLLSAGGIVLVLVMWLATALYAHFAKRPKDEVQKLFGGSGDEDHDD